MTSGTPSFACDLFDEPTVADADIARTAYLAGLTATRMLSRSEQRDLGQYMTPVAIGREMANRALALLCPSDTCRILDPAAGSGVLAAAVVEAALANGRQVRRIELLLCEVDNRLHGTLRDVSERLAARCATQGVRLEWTIQEGDFLLSALARSGQPCVDVVIANPPYFKLGKQDPRAQAHLYAVHGQPNIYGLFMAACAALVRPGGVWCFITPRSWTGGDYFARVRRYVFDKLQLAALHVFDSRTAHFDDDAVLQEAIIAWAVASDRRATVEVGSSAGAAGVASAPRCHVDTTSIVGSDAAVRVQLPSQRPGIERLGGRLSKLGWGVSTGPVVAFRARRWLASEAGQDTVPLLWMQHVRRMSVRWPIERKVEHIRSEPAARWMLVPSRPMVVLRRFSPKEDVRRITAAAWLGDIEAEAVGLENHLNYVRAIDGEMTRDEALGLAAYLNSEPVDAWLRNVIGHTQVNAADLRRMPLPDRETIAMLGRRIGAAPDLLPIDAAVLAIVEGCAGDVLG